ncbi:MAG: TonB-dependent receptor plug domain-containing protein [Gammaproteobacteria bacterium]
MPTKYFYCVILWMGTLLSGIVWAIDPDELDIVDTYGGEQYINIATGNRKPLRVAPAVASVISASDIQKMGATELNQVLESVPGLHVSASTTNFNPVFTIRGIFSDFNSQVLVLVNGLPITSVFTGNRGQVWGGMPVQNISRIEVIRGPGSAIYGADAFAGVINIVTKTADELDGLDSGFRAGNFDTQEGWLQYGGRIRDLNVAFSFQAGSTDGQHRIVESDAQTFFDGLFGTRASLAPGPVSVGRRYVDTNLDLSLDDWHLRLWWQGRDRVGTGAGFAQALDPSGSSSSSRFNADLTYENDHWLEDWGLSAQLSFYDIANRSDLVLFPSGSAFPQLDPDTNQVIAVNSFPDGVRGSPDVFERHYRAELSGIYTGFSNHALRTGAGYRFQDMYKVNDDKNFFQAGNPLPIPLQPGQTGTPFLVPHSRGDVYGFIQDEWNLWKDWTLTGGVRYDYYSDFGSTVNPRLALVWQTSYSLTSKLLYGRAFRAPSFGEQFANMETPAFLGNSDLKPETINTLELAFDYQPVDEIRSKLNLFHYWYDDIIRPVADPGSTNQATRKFQNSGTQTGYGLELEGEWTPYDFLHLQANYAFQRSHDNSSDGNAGFAPTHQVYARLDWKFHRDWNLDVQSNWVGDRKRTALDRRAQVPDYFTVDMAVRGQNIFDDWGLSLSVWNLFNANAREPSPPFANFQSSLVPGDFPTLGRSYYFELRYHLN